MYYRFDMTGKDIIDNLRHAAIDAKKRGHDEVSINQLLAAFTMLEEDLQSGEESEQVLITEFDNSMQIEKFRMSQNTQLEVYKTVNENGRHALRSLFILNGGAAVAMAAFIGNASKSVTATSLNLETLSVALYFFAFGVFFAALAHGSNYICSFFYAEYNNSKMAKIGHAINIFTIIVAITGYCSFVVGLLNASRGFFN